MPYAELFTLLYSLSSPLLEQLSTTRAATLIADNVDLRLRYIKTFFDSLRHPLTPPFVTLTLTRTLILHPLRAHMSSSLFCPFERSRSDWLNSRKEHSSTVSIHMLEIMAAIIDEADELDGDFIECLLETLLEGNGKGGRSAEELSARLIRRSAESLKPGIVQFLGRLLTYPMSGFNDSCVFSGDVGERPIGQRPS